MKKLISIILSIMMLTCVITAVLADGASVLNDQAVTQDNEAVRFEKELTVYNPDNAEVNEPTASYTYTISAATAGDTITDNDSKQAITKAGVGLDQIKMSSQTTTTATTTTSVSLTYAPDSGNKLNASSTGAKNTKWIEIDFSDVVFGAAGVYRYKIEESNYTYNSNGVVAGTTGHDRYLDVYVRDSTANDSSITATMASYWEIYGYAMFTADENIDAKTDPKETKKTTGFVSHTDGDPTVSTNAKTADQYYTFNLTIQKTVVNDSHIKTTKHKFPFTVTLANTTVTANVLPIMTLSTNATQTALQKGPISGTWAPQIADGESVTYVGIPTGTTITIKEKNNVSGTTYQVSSSGADQNISSESIAYNTETSVVTVNGASAGAAASANKTVVFSNNLQNISPTGYITRYAPYGILLIAGVALFVIALKRRKHNDEEEKE